MKLEHPLQGVQKTITLDGVKQRVGHYNSFAGRYSCQDIGEIIDRHISFTRNSPDAEDPEITRDANKSIDYIFSPSHKMMGVQFHPESVMTQNGQEILKNLLMKLIKTSQ